jgi:hypothetical protein
MGAKHLRQFLPGTDVHIFKGATNSLDIKKNYAFVSSFVNLIFLNLIFDCGIIR